MAEPAPLSVEAWLYVEAHRVGHLATVDAAGQPAVVPLCYATDGQAIYSALDDKPKRTPPEDLQRVRNIRAHPQVALVIDDYTDDWARLTYLLIHGQADIVAPGAAEHAHAVTLLRAKYPQYQRMPIEARGIIRIRPLRSRYWSGSGGAAALGDSETDRAEDARRWLVHGHQSRG